MLCIPLLYKLVTYNIRASKHTSSIRLFNYSLKHPSQCTVTSLVYAKFQVLISQSKVKCMCCSLKLESELLHIHIYGKIILIKLLNPFIRYIHMCISSGLSHTLWLGINPRIIQSQFNYVVPCLSLSADTTFATSESIYLPIHNLIYLFLRWNRTGL